MTFFPERERERERERGQLLRDLANGGGLAHAVDADDQDHAGVGGQIQLRVPHGKHRALGSCPHRPASSIREFYTAYKYKPSGNIFSERLIWFILSNSVTEFPV